MILEVVVTVALVMVVVALLEPWPASLPRRRPAGRVLPDLREARIMGWDA